MPLVYMFDARKATGHHRFLGLFRRVPQAFAQWLIARPGGRWAHLDYAPHEWGLCDRKRVCRRCAKCGIACWHSFTGQ